MESTKRREVELSKLKKEAERDVEKERAENYRRQEESRQMELQRLEQLKMKQAVDKPKDDHKSLF